MKNTSIASFPEAQALGLPATRIEDIANVVATGLSFDALIDDMHTLVSKLGCSIHLIDAGRDLDVQGTLEVRGSFDWSVYLPSGTGPIHDRFTLAHELGHFVLHSKMGSQPIHAFRSFNSERNMKPAEIEADQFALAWLMPKDAFLKEAEGCDNDIDALSVTFEVLPEIAKYRLESLKGN